MAKMNEYLTVGEAAEYLGVHPDSLRRWDRAGKLEPRRHPINNFRLYLRRDPDKFLAQISGKGKAATRLQRVERRSGKRKKTQRIAAIHQPPCSCSFSSTSFS